MKRSRRASGGYLGLVGVIANLLTGWVSTVVAIEGCGVATVSYHVATPGAWHGTVTANTERQESSSATVTTNDGPPWGTSVSTRTSRTSVDVTDRFFLGGTDEQADMGYIALDGRQYTNGAATDETHGTIVNAWSGSGCNYNFQEDTTSGGGWSFDVEARGTISLYPDGRYTISFNGGGWDEDVNVPGEHVEQVTPLNDCIDTGSGTEEAGFHPSPTVGSGTTNMVEGRLDPESPGNVLRGSMTITNFDLSVTTITWNIVHEGPIRLPFQ